MDSHHTVQNKILPRTDRLEKKLRRIYDIKKIVVFLITAISSYISYIVNADNLLVPYTVGAATEKTLVPAFVVIIRQHSFESISGLSCCWEH